MLTSYFSKTLLGSDVQLSFVLIGPKNRPTGTVHVVLNIAKVELFCLCTNLQIAAFKANHVTSHIR